MRILLIGMGLFLFMSSTKALVPIRHVPFIEYKMMYDGTANDCPSYSKYKGDDGYIYFRYSNKTDNYYIIKYQYVNENGDWVKNYIEAKPNIQFTVQIGKGDLSSFSVTSCEEID